MEMEKSGVISLTKEDMDIFQQQKEVSDRVKELWGLTYSELYSKIIAGAYTLI